MPGSSRRGYVEPRRNTMWLPRWRATANPRRSSARTTSAPETRGSLGMLCDLECRDQRLTDRAERELFQIQLGGLAQIGDRLFDRFAFGGRAGLGIQGR